MSDSSTPPAGSPQTPNPHSHSGQTSPSPAQQPKADRSSIIAVTALPVLVVIAGVLGFLTPDTFTPLAPTITWSLGVVMFFMGLTLTLPDFARIAKKPWIAALGVVTQFIAMPLLGLLVVTLFNLPAEIAVGVILVGGDPGHGLECGDLSGQGRHRAVRVDHDALNPARSGTDSPPTCCRR